MNEKWARFAVTNDRVAFTDFSGADEKEMFYADLPSDIKGKIAKLRLLVQGDGEYGIGVHVAKNVFFV